MPMSHSLHSCIPSITLVLLPYIIPYLTSLDYSSYRELSQFIVSCKEVEGCIIRIQGCVGI